MHRVRGIVQHYSWGDRTAIPEMLGLPSDGRPWAEVWFGTHPNGTSSVAPLDRFAPSSPASSEPLTAVTGDLPFMVKLLAAAAPLSLQTHPSAEQAAEGFARDEAAGIPLGSVDRTYTDAFAKPEVLIALSRFIALCGVRPLAATQALLAEIGGAAARLGERLADQGVHATIAEYLVDQRPTLAVVEACRRSNRPEARLVLELERRYPADPGVVITLLLNLVSLKPGQALYLTPGNLHAYVHGTGVEVMGASDNVVRGGLTHKPVDPDELLAILDPTPLETPRIALTKVHQGLWRYETPGAPFTVHAQHVPGRAVVTAEHRELVLCALGETDLLRAGEVLALAPGETVTLEGTATLFRAADA